MYPNWLSSPFYETKDAYVIKLMRMVLMSSLTNVSPFSAVSRRKFTALCRDFNLSGVDGWFPEAIRWLEAQRYGHQVTSMY